MNFSKISTNKNRSSKLFSVTLQQKGSSRKKSAYSFNAGIALVTEARGDKSDETKAGSPLIDISGKTITADAMSHAERYL
jgi:hypothetical protein